jgi:hypothetical protein
MTIRYNIERLLVITLKKEDERWVRETFTGNKTIHAARKEMAEIKAEGAPWHQYRIVKVTTTRRVVK